MKVKIEITDPINHISCDNERELKFLESDMVSSKLACKIVSDLKNLKQLMIKEGNNYRFNQDNTVFIPETLYQNPRKMCFYIRAILDANSVRQNCMPFHAAAFQKNEEIAFLLGKSKGGKSTVLEKLCKKDVIPIGDDHIIIGENRFVKGNGIMRLRDLNGKESYQKILTKKPLILRGYKIFVVEIGEKCNQFQFNSEQFYRNQIIQSTALKYLKANPLEKNARPLINKLSKIVLPDYILMFKKFINDASSRFWISGDLEYITNEILENVGV